jgi:hypothetical protein
MCTRVPVDVGPNLYFLFFIFLGTQRSKFTSKATQSIFQNQTWCCWKNLWKNEVMDSIHDVMGNICVRVIFDKSFQLQ